MPALWNLGSACCGGRNARITVKCLNLVHQVGVIPLGFTLCNVYPVKSKGYFTGACPACLLARSDRIGGDRLDLLNQGHVNPLGLEVHRESGGFAPCNPTLPTKHLSLGIHAIPSEQNPCNPSRSIPLGLYHF